MLRGRLASSIEIRECWLVYPENVDNILVQPQRTDNTAIEEEVVVMAKEESYGLNKAQYWEISDGKESKRKDLGYHFIKIIYSLS